VAVPLGDVTQITFDFTSADQRSDRQPEAGDSPFRAEVTDGEDNKFAATELKMPFYDGGQNTGHVLPVYIDSMLFTINFRFLRKFEVLQAPLGGVIIKLGLLDDRELVGFVPQNRVSQISGNIGVGTFNLDLGKLKMVQFQ
jgi:hypothetical protein